MDYIFKLIFEKDKLLLKSIDQEKIKIPRIIARQK